MKKYQIEVEEVLQKIIDVEANSLNEAISAVEEKYRNEEIVLDSGTIKETNIKEYINNIERIKKKSKDMER